MFITTASVLLVSILFSTSQETKQHFNKNFTCSVSIRVETLKKYLNTKIINEYSNS